MKLKPLLTLALILCVVGWACAPSHAQQHRATHLGNPNTRFAPPLKTPEDLRALFQNPQLQADIGAILAQSDWQGNQEDLRSAAGTADIRALRIPPGTRLSAMSTRKKGQPVLLKDVLWAGKKPFEAYEFKFISNDQRYRVVTPKDCSNFWVERLERELHPGLEVIKTFTEATVCAPFETRIVVRNTGKREIARIRVADTLPAGLKLSEDQTPLAWEIGSLDPSEGREYRFKVVAAAPGSYTNTVRVASFDGGNLEAQAVAAVGAPALGLVCDAPREVFAGRPAEVCLTLTNTGNAPEPTANLELLIPQGAAFVGATEGGAQRADRVVWEFRDFAPQSSRKACATFTLAQPGSLSFNASARGGCAQPAQTQCATRISGIPAILVEVIDLEDPILVGNSVTYDIQVTNQGSATLTQLKIVCTLAEGQEFVQASGVTPAQAQGQTVTMQPLAALEPKAVASWRVVAKATQARDARFKTEVIADQFQRPVEEFEATQQY